MDVSVIIVNYKTPALLLRCVQSIVAHTKGVAYEVVVVDNHSEDNSRELLEAHGLKVVWKDTGYNSGFARANNMGLKMAQGNYALLFNSDAYLNTDAITAMWNYYRSLEVNYKTGLLGCKIVDENGKLLRGTHRGFPGIDKVVNANPLVIFIKRLAGLNLKIQAQSTEAEQLHFTNHEADIISGACVFTNLKVLKEQSLYLDEDFFLYSEDVEWSYRYKKKGFRHFFTSDTEIYHTDSGSATVNSFKAMQMLISRWLFIYKAYGLLYYNLYMWLLRLNLFLDDLFYKEAKSSKAQVNAAVIRQKEKGAWNKYALLIPSCYTRAPSSAQNFLAYVE